MWNSANNSLKLLFVTLSLTAFLSVLILNVDTAFSQNEDVSYLDVNSTSSTQLSKFSIAAWFKTSTDYNTDAFIVNKAGASANMNYGIWMTNAEKIRGGFESASGSAFYATSPLSYSDGKWHYAVVTFDGSAIGLYIDGLSVATKSAVASPDSGGDQPIRMGANSETLNNYFVGNVDEIRIWKTALSPQQVIDASNGKFNSNDEIEYLDFSEPIIQLNNTTAVNATVTNQTGFQDINGTVTNDTSDLSTPVVSNETNKTNGTDNTIIPVEEPQLVNDTGMNNDAGMNNDTGTGNQQQTQPPEENNSPESSDQSVSVDQGGQVEITLIATDKDDDPLQFDVTADPLQGSLVDFDKEKGTVTYVPQNNYFGEDKFTFKVIDDKGSQSNAAEVKVNVKETTHSAQNELNNENKVVESITNTTGASDDTQAQNTQSDDTQAQNTQSDDTQAQNTPPNVPPKADAGDDQKVEVNTEAKLDGSKSSDEDGKIASYKWEQTDGPEVHIKKADTQTASFDVPESAADSKLVFKLTVVDDKGDSAFDEVEIQVQKISVENSN